jgi:hypothetical protein
MASGQMFATSGQRKKKRNQLTELRARQEMFPQILAAEQAAELQRKEEEFRNKQLAQEQKQYKSKMKFQREESRKMMGLEGAKLGTTLLSADLGFDIGKPSIKPAGTNPSGENVVATKEGFNLGGGLQGGLSGGLLGFGLGSMFGSGKKKWIGAGLGALAGGILGGGLGKTIGGFFTGLGSN